MVTRSAAEALFRDLAGHQPLNQSPALEGLPFCVHSCDQERLEGMHLLDVDVHMALTLPLQPPHELSDVRLPDNAQGNDSCLHPGW